MDYDDNEFQSQNFQLVAEDSSRFSPGFQSYPLPKYDLDEHLQVHLRFDSLIESDILLGIQGQVENHWIGDFSTGSSGIEFGSSAAESCSISRCENVWSEAPSSESVAMLLKSVEQDERIKEQPLIEELDTCDGLVNVANQMDPGVSLDSSLHPEIGDDVYTSSSLLADNDAQSIPMLNKDVTGNLSPVEDVTRNFEDKNSGCESSGVVDMTSVGEKLSVIQEPVAQDCSLENTVASYHAKFEDVLINDNMMNAEKCQETVRSNDDGSKRKGEHDDHGSAEVDMDGNSRDSGPSTITTSFVVDATMLNNQNFMERGVEGHNEVVLRKVTGSLLRNEVQRVESGILFEDEQMNDQQPEGDLTEIKGNVVEKSSGLPNVDSLKESSEECLAAGKLDLPGADVNEVRHLVSSKGTETGDSSLETMQISLLVEGDKHLKGHFITTKDTSISLLKTGSPCQITGGDGDSKDVNHFVKSITRAGDIVMVDRIERLESETSSVVVQAGQSGDNEYLESDNHNSLIPDDSSIIASPARQVVVDNDACCDGGSHVPDGSAYHAGSSHMETNVMDNYKSNVGNCTNSISVPEDAIPEGASNVQDSCKAKVDVFPSGVSDVEKMHKMVSIPPEIPQLETGSLAASQCQMKDTMIAVVHASPAVLVINHQPVSIGFTQGDAIEFCSLNKSRDVHPLVSEDHPVSNEVVEQKKGLDHSDKEVELQQNDGFSMVASGPIPNLSREHNLDAAPVETGSVAKDADSTCQNELQASKDAAVPCESDSKLEKIPPSVTSAMEMKISSVSERVGLGKLEDTSSLITGMEKSSSRTTNNCKPLSVETGHMGPNTFETKWDSANVISSDHLSRNENEHLERNKNPSEKNCAASESLKCIPYECGRNHGPTDSADTVPKKLNVSEDGRSFSFEVKSVENLPENVDGKGWKSLPNAQLAEIAQVKLKETAHGNHLVSDEEKLQGVGDMDIGEARKPVSLSGGSSERVGVTKTKPVKESSRSKRLARKDNISCNPSTSSMGSITRDISVEGISRFAYHEGSVKPSCAPLLQAATLPDLNSSFSVATLFHQPFTDLQQVQLRAQIIVYGSLIQGVPPDEACMISAFGGADGGRSTWEGAWRAAAERFYVQRSPLNNPDTPVHMRSGMRITEQTSRSPASQAGSKIPPLTTLNPAVSLQSPLWNISTPLHDGLHSNMPRGTLQDTHRALPPLHGYQSPQARPYVGKSSPWAVPQTSAVDSSGQYTVLPILETVQVTPIRESSIPFSPMQIIPPNVFPAGTSLRFSATSTEAKAVPATSVPATAEKLPPGESKSRKRKKNIIPGLTQIPSVSQPQTDTPAVIGVTLQSSCVGSLSTSSQPDKPATCSVISSTNYQIIGRGDKQRATLSEETCSKLEQAKQSAIDAATLATSAVRHSQEVWNDLANHNGSNSVPQLESKLASAAVAIGAAASVAKAAAAAAKVACDSAVLAKMMADEALGVIKVGHSAQNIESSVSDGGKNLGTVSPALILKGKEKMTSSSSVLVTALETSRKRVEETSAATKRAENLAAVMRAAELAFDAILQAGAVVSMGDPVPLSLSDLIEAGPDGYWKLQKLTGDSVVRTNSMPITQPQPDGTGSVDGSDENHEHLSNDKDVRQSTDKVRLPSTDFTRQSVERCRDINGKCQDFSNSEKGLGYIGQKLSTMSKPAGMVCDLDTGSGNELKRDQSEEILNGSSIKEGSSVEVLSGGIWYSARVLNLKDGMAYVCYTECGTDEGGGQLKEWILLQDDKAPRIRNVRPVKALKFEGTRKRKKTNVWAAGDRVDVWTGVGWREGIVKEKNKEDETLLIVYFPVGGEVSPIREWDLRSSLIWKDGEWIEWSRLRDYNYVPNQGDTPMAKHHKLDRPEPGVVFQAEFSKKDILSKHSVIGGLHKPEEAEPLPLSEKDRTFVVGKDIKRDNNSEALRMKRTGLQKAGSGVIFGIPKPGKKRKFMEVSKHYISNGASKVSEGNDHSKVEKSLIPQPSRGWKPPPKLDPKGKRAGDVKSKILKPGKSQNVQSTSEKDSSSVSEGIIHETLPNVKISDGKEYKQTEVGSILDLITTGDNAKEGPSSRRKPVSAGELRLGAKAKFGYGAENSGRGEVKGPGSIENHARSALDPIEPRRSNRRIQPTPKFLEGLQSSLIITKVPSISHDRSVKSSNRSTTSLRGRNKG
ncbi:hypothetical protein QJS04_geneDACA018458 [Acorus gramineus]|uniref:Agenet domain-containing protein n=1 Tax=Acorus gramineus TaxID=55184 RepID=A0AAV9ACK7_ACOGR|nr:hypothetical protein QJS04_geneDACA018458 [Acorus gramineus]